MYPIETDEYQEGGDPSCSGTPITNTMCMILLEGSKDAQTDLMHLIRSTDARWCRIIPGVLLVEGRISSDEWLVRLKASRSIWNPSNSLLVLETRFSEWNGLLQNDKWEWMDTHLVAGNNE